MTNQPKLTTVANTEPATRVLCIESRLRNKKKLKQKIKWESHLIYQCFSREWVKFLFIIVKEKIKVWYESVSLSQKRFFFLLFLRCFISRSVCRRITFNTIIKTDNYCVFCSQQRSHVHWIFKINKFQKKIDCSMKINVTWIFKVALVFWVEAIFSKL